MRHRSADFDSPPSPYAVRPRERKLERRNVFQPAQMVRADGSTIGQGTMVDVSGGGARVQIPDVTGLPDEFILVLSPYGARVQRRCAVVWRGKAEVGIRFVLD